MAVMKRGKGNSYSGMELLEIAGDEDQEPGLRDWASRARFKMAELHARYKSRAYGFSFVKVDGQRMSFSKFMLGKEIDDEEQGVLTHTGHGVDADDVADVVDVMSAEDLDPHKWAAGEHDHLQQMLDFEKENLRKRLAAKLVVQGHLDSRFVSIYADPVSLTAARIQRGLKSSEASDDTTIDMTIKRKKL
jgi:hypothetical protein